MNNDYSNYLRNLLSAEEAMARKGDSFDIDDFRDTDYLNGITDDVVIDDLRSRFDYDDDELDRNYLAYSTDVDDDYVDNDIDLDSTGTFSESDNHVDEDSIIKNALKGRY